MDKTTRMTFSVQRTTFKADTVTNSQSLKCSHVLFVSSKEQQVNKKNRVY